MLGYGNGDEATIISFGEDTGDKHATTYFRSIFSLDDPDSITRLTLQLDRDDGAVVYLNGVEVTRSNMPGGTVSYTTLAATCGSEISDIDIDPNQLLNGVNTLAVEVHQCSTQSSDVRFDLALTGFSSTLPPGSGSEYYVSPDGSPNGDGSWGDPWDLQTALDHPSAVNPGDMIWMRGGTYQGQYTSRLKGAVNNPVTLRQYPGERATIDASGKALTISDSYWANYWGFEITSSTNPREIIEGPGSGDGIRINQGENSHHIRFINLIIHDNVG